MTPIDRGILIAFEGIDGAGKTTQVELLERFFKDADVPHVRSKEPTDGPRGQMIRSSARTGRMSLDQELHAFVQDRNDHVRDLIRPAMAAGQAVILDRYFYSTIAYQGSRGADVAKVAKWMAAFPVPDVVFLIDVPPAVGISRIEDGRDGGPNQFEVAGGLRDARAVFLGLAGERPEIVRIDGTQSVELVRRSVLRTLLDGGVLKARYCAKAYGCDAPELCASRLSGTCTWARMCKASNLAG